MKRSRKTCPRSMSMLQFNNQCLLFFYVVYKLLGMLFVLQTYNFTKVKIFGIVISFWLQCYPQSLFLRDIGSCMFISHPGNAFCFAFFLAIVLLCTICRARKKDKLRYRYPRGESYLDVIQRYTVFLI